MTGYGFLTAMRRYSPMAPCLRKARWRKSAGFSMWQ